MYVFMALKTQNIVVTENRNEIIFRPSLKRFEIL